MKSHTMLDTAYKIKLNMKQSANLTLVILVTHRYDLAIIMLACKYCSQNVYYT